MRVFIQSLPRPFRSPVAAGGIVQRIALVVFFAVLLAILLGGWQWSGEFRSRDSDRPRLVPAADGQAAPGAESGILDSAVLPIEPSEAKALNDARPVDVARPHAARPFALPASHLRSRAYAASLRCLAEAVFYEAGNQGDAGGRAVAQVVLNRVRHPAFPHTVCGVIYQGYARATGCQFTFTCDGSLAREPSVRGWDRALRIAREALAGAVDANVGLATHFHADYVVPYWAPSLAKIGRVGTHLFYQLPGRLGAAAAFTARYDPTGELASSAGRPSIAIVPEKPGPEMVAGSPAPPLSAQPGLLSDSEAGALVPQGGELRQRIPELVADTVAGSLRVGEGAVPLADGQGAPRR